MTKEEYREQVCPSCVNYEYKRQGEDCSKFESDGCKNYRRIFACGKRICNGCGRCG